MKASSLKIGHQGALLVVILLGLELLFVGINAWLLVEAESESKKQERNKEIVAQSSRLLQRMYDAGDAAGKFGFNQNQREYRRYVVARDEIPEILRWLKMELQESPEDTKSIEKIEKNVNVGLGVLADIVKSSQENGREMSMQVSYLAMRKLQPRIEELGHDQMEFLTIQRAKIAESPAVQKKHRDRIKLLLLVGVVLNVLFAVLLGLFFVRNITSRLQVVVKNAERLRSKRELIARMGGKDEIAQLDATFHDMAATLRGEEELLRASEEQLRSMIDQMPVGLLMVSPNDRIGFANPMAEALFGFTSDELIGRDLSKLLDAPGDGRQTFAEQIFKRAKERVVELNACKKNGRTFPVEFTMADISGDKMSRKLATVIDVTERHELQKMRREFVAMVSHELRTPLNAVSGFLELLPVGVFGAISEQAAAEVAVADRNVDQLISLINDLLDLEKLEAGQMNLLKAATNLEDVIDETINEIADAAHERDISPHFEGCSVEIVVDADRLQQCLRKILAFLISFTPQESTITIEGRREPVAGVRIEIASPSLRLPEDKLETIFERFQQLDLTHVHGSTGLGLALAKSIIEQHQGTIRIEKMKDGGTGCVIQLPV